MVISARRCPGQEDTDASLALSFVLAGDAAAARSVNGLAGR